MFIVIHSIPRVRYRNKLITLLVGCLDAPYFCICSGSQNFNQDWFFCSNSLKDEIILSKVHIFLRQRDRWVIWPQSELRTTVVSSMFVAINFTDIVKIKVWRICKLVANDNSVQYYIRYYTSVNIYLLINSTTGVQRLLIKPQNFSLKWTETKRDSCFYLTYPHCFVETPGVIVFSGLKQRQDQLLQITWQLRLQIRDQILQNNGDAIDCI